MSNEKLIVSCYAGNLNAVREAFSEGADVNYIEPSTGLSALHISVGQNDSAIAKALVEEFNAAFFADRTGRWPSLLAAACRADDELSDYICHAEAKFLAKQPS